MGQERTLGDILVNFENPTYEAALKRAEEVVRTASLNEAIRVIEQLEQEVAQMPIAKRFRRDLKPGESVYGRDIATMNPALKGLNEAEYKRQTLLIELRRIKAGVISAVANLKGVVLDIEATKRD